MMLTTLVTLSLPLGAVMLASVAGALLAPLRLSVRRTVLWSQWSTRQTPIAAPPCRTRTA
jgi:hypothetical protein